MRSSHSMKCTFMQAAGLGFRYVCEEFKAAPLPGSCFGSIPHILHKEMLMDQNLRPGTSMRILRPPPCAVSAAVAAGTCPTAVPTQRSCGPATCAGSLGIAAGSAPTVRSSPLTVHKLPPCTLTGPPSFLGKAQNLRVHGTASKGRLAGMITLPASLCSVLTRNLTGLLRHLVMCPCSALLQVQPARPPSPRLLKRAGLCPALGTSLPAMRAPRLPCCPSKGLCQVLPLV